MSDLIDIVDHYFIRQVAKTAHRAARRSARAQHSLSEIEEQVSRLTLITTSLWELLKERVAITDAELLAKIREVDLRDGKLDGARTMPSGAPCPACSRMTNRRNIRCIYCGHRLPAVTIG
jgi:hypothetical protein